MANCFLGALPAVLLRAVCFVRAMVVVVVLLRGGRVVVCLEMKNETSIRSVCSHQTADRQIQSRCEQALQRSPCILHESAPAWPMVDGRRENTYQNLRRYI